MLFLSRAESELWVELGRGIVANSVEPGDLRGTVRDALIRLGDRPADSSKAPAHPSLNRTEHQSSEPVVTGSRFSGSIPAGCALAAAPPA